MASIPAFAFEKDFWDVKPAGQWSKDEIVRMLTQSPWTRPAEVKGNFPGPLGGARGSYVGLMNIYGIPIQGEGGSPLPVPAGARAEPAAVRWESALPIRDAFHSTQNADFDKFYVLHLLGDLPMLGGAAADDEVDPAEFDRRVDMFKQYTRLEHKSGPLQLERVERSSRIHVPGNGYLFYYSRADEIAPGDGQVSFFTKLGPLDVTARFKLKDMSYRGKLAL